MSGFYSPASMALPRFSGADGKGGAYFRAIILIALIPARRKLDSDRKTKALWQFLLGGIAVCAVTYLAAEIFLFPVQCAGGSGN